MSISEHDRVAAIVADVAPWSAMLDPERDGPWDAYALWEKWLIGQMTDAAQEAWDELGDNGGWKENLYAIMSRQAGR